MLCEVRAVLVLAGARAGVTMLTLNLLYSKQLRCEVQCLSGMRQLTTDVFP